MPRASVLQAKIVEYFKSPFVQSKLKIANEGGGLGQLSRLFEGKAITHALIVPEVKQIANELLAVKPADFTQEIWQTYLHKVTLAAYPLFFDANGIMHQTLIDSINLNNRNLYSDLAKSDNEEFYKQLLWSYVFRWQPVNEYLKKHKIPLEGMENINSQPNRILQIMEKGNEKFLAAMTITATKQQFDIKELINQLQILLAEIEQEIIKYLLLFQLSLDQSIVYPNTNHCSKRHLSEHTFDDKDTYYQALKETSIVLQSSLQTLQQNSKLTPQALVQVKLKTASAFIELASVKLSKKQEEIRLIPAYSFFSSSKDIALKKQQEIASFTSKLKSHKDAIDSLKDQSNTTEDTFALRIEHIKQDCERYKDRVKQHINLFYRFLALFGIHKKTATEALVQAAYKPLCTLV